MLWIQGFFPCIPTRPLGKVGSSFPIQCSRRSLFTFLTSMMESHNRVLHEAAIATRKSFHFTSISTALKSMRRTQIITSTPRLRLLELLQPTSTLPFWLVLKWKAWTPQKPYLPFQEMPCSCKKPLRWSSVHRANLEMESWANSRETSQKSHGSITIPPTPKCPWITCMTTRPQNEEVLRWKTRAM